MSARTGELLWSGGDAPAWRSGGTARGRGARDGARRARAGHDERGGAAAADPADGSGRAEEAYFQGRFQLSDYGADAARARSMPSTVRLPPTRTTPRRYASEAVAYLRLASFNRIAHSEAGKKRAPRLPKAYKSGADNAEAHAAAADLKFLYDWDWNGAEQESVEAST